MPAEEVKWVGLGGEELLRGLLGHDAADVDEIISDHTEADPALHSGIAFVAAAIETVSPLDHADGNPRIRCAISGRCGTSVSSARVCAPGSWWSDWECRRA